MQSDQHLILHSGGLSICPALGEVSNHRGESARLGPVNMKVLALLIGRPQTLISRGEIFDGIWKNQVVSDDALTRCISDIRSQLKQLCPEQDFIETLPRRGYRWLLEVKQDKAGGEAAGTERAAEESTEIANLINNHHKSNGLLTWTGRVLVYLAAILLITSASVWLLDRFSQPALPIVAILPGQADAELLPLATNIEEAITAQLLDLETVQLLSKTAIASRPSNPFPYLYFEFGVRWVVESDVRLLAGNEVVTVTLVDARTGIILHQVTEVFNGKAVNWQDSDALKSFTEYLNVAGGF